MAEYEYSGWRPIREHQMPLDPRKGERPEDAAVIPATKFFDQLSYIGNEFVGCFVLETKDGLVQIDCLDTDPRYIEILEQGYRDLNLDIRALKAVLITHGHPDHFGNANYLRKCYGCKLYMSSVDIAFAQDPNCPRAPGSPYLTYDMDGYIEGGDVFTLGGTKIKIYATPGHTPGCLSFIIPVTDEGRPHKVALWGGTGIASAVEHGKAYLKSSDYFTEMCIVEGVDCEIATHPFVDNTKERLEVCRKITNGTANPFVIGADAAVRYQQQFRHMCEARLFKALGR